jgi:hypothetical protein
MGLGRQRPSPASRSMPWMIWLAASGHSEATKALAFLTACAGDRLADLERDLEIAF